MLMETKNCLVTGGLGLLGTSIVEKLLKKGHQVTVVDDLSFCEKSLTVNDIKWPFMKDVTFVNGDISDSKFIDSVKNTNFDWIFNFGSYSSDRYFEKNDKDGIYKTIFGMLNVLKLSSQMGDIPVIYPSSGTVYGNSISPQREDQQLKPQTLYSITKIYLEMLSKMFAKTRSYGLRIFTGYGPREIYKGNIAGVVTLFTLSALKGENIEVYGDGEQKRDFIEADDVAEIAVRIANSNMDSTEINCGSGKSYSFNDLIKLIAEKVEKEVKVVHVESKTRFVAETRPDITKLKTIIGFEPPDLKKKYNLYFEKLLELYNS